MSIDIAAIQKIRESNLVSMNELARQADIPPATMHGKLRRGSELKVDEARRIERVLRRAICQHLKEPAAEEE